MSQCTATSKQSGQRCKRHAVRGRAVCSMHGGHTPRGIQHYNYKTGRYTKSLVGNLLGDYLTAREDTDLLNLQEEIALIDARLAAVLARTRQGESNALWKQARTAWQAFDAATLGGDASAIAAARADVAQALERGHMDYAAWNDVTRLMETRRKLVESERRRMVDMRALVSTEELMVAVRALVSAVRLYVKDPGTLRNIVGEIERTLGRSADRSTDHGRADATISHYRAD